MGYARYVGRVGALAVTLGVGLAVANTPGIAYAEPVGSAPSASDSSAPSKDPSPKFKTPKVKQAQSPDESDSTDSPPSDPKPASDPADQATPKTDDDEGAEKVDAAAEPTIGEGSAEDDEETPPVADDASAKDDGPVKGSGGHRLRATPPAADSDEVKTSVTADVGQSNRSQSPTSNTNSIADDQVPDSSTDTVATFATTFSARTMAASSAPIAPQPRPTVVGLITNLVSAVLQPFMSPGTGVPMLPSLLLGVLAAVRNEIERALFRQTSSPTSQFTVTQIDPTPNTLAVDPNPNVLVIGVDGTNLARILADPRNQNFFTLMDDSTTGASSIVGHTTISNPSWSTMLTGVWSERTGVINNVFTPWTYDKWPTVFNQLEEHNSGIETTTIADWDVINAISGGGSIPVDTNIYLSQIDGDTDWSQTDDAVGEATVDAIEDTPGGVPAFIFSYFVGVDENGHMHGGASPQYADAIVNVDENLGDIMTAVGDWETAHPTEGEWTVLVVTDHGHQPQKGFGHGFQTPDETSTFVIANGPGFNEGFVNPKYAIVDTTPTVLTLFGAPVPTYVDGVSLTTLGGSDLDPVDLHQALQDQIASNHSPGLLTNVALSLRTIFATIPYYVWTLNNDGTIPVPLLGNVLYVVTNVPAQIIARLTGVTGARIFPLLPPGPPSWPGKEETITSDTSTLACDGGDPAAVSCDAASVA